MENNISQMFTTNTPIFHEIFHNQIAKWMPYLLDSLTNSFLKVWIEAGLLAKNLFFTWTQSKKSHPAAAP